MQVFKLYFKILKTMLGQVLMYIGIFTGISVLLFNQQKNNDPFDYKEASQKISIVDNDNSAASQALSKNLTASNELIELPDYESDTIQDELYNRNVSNVIIIPNGFSDALIKNEAGDMITVYNLPGTMMASIVTNNINNYIKTLQANLVSRQNVSEADMKECISLTDTALAKKADVEITSHIDTKLSLIKDLYRYLAYLFIALAVSSVSPILVSLYKKDVNVRQNCSAIKQSSYNMQLFLSILLTGAGFCSVFVVLALVLAGPVIFSLKGLLYILNMVIFMTISLAIAFLVANITSTSNVLSMFANIIGLGCSFLGGVFVPIEMLSDGVIKAAHFLPSYWYIVGNNSILTMGTQTSVTDTFAKLGIEALFALAIILVALTIQKIKRTA